MYFSSYLSITLLVISVAHCDKPEEENPPPIPYSFSYTAGRMPGHTDRVHAETSDGTGVIRGKGYVNPKLIVPDNPICCEFSGMFSYIDPRYKVRTVEYVADKDGFHPIVITNPVTDTSSVAKAKERHQQLFEKIAYEHQAIAQERGHEDDGKYTPEQYPEYPAVEVQHPRDTPTVEHAKAKHYNQYQKIAEEHARIAQERKLGNPEGGVVISYQY